MSKDALNCIFLHFEATLPYIYVTYSPDFRAAVIVLLTYIIHLKEHLKVQQIKKLVCCTAGFTFGSKYNYDKYRPGPDPKISRASHLMRGVNRSDLHYSRPPSNTAAVEKQGSHI